jgi:prepilin-type N-terminal cleavage/methylation domain-containing protein
MDKGNMQIQKMKGFSLLEIILTVAILLLLSIFLFPFTLGKFQEVQLKNYSTKLVEDIYFQQQQARNQNIYTGIALESGKYTLFTGETLESSTEKDVKNLEKGYTISNISLNEGTTILFSPGSVKPTKFGTFVLNRGQSSIRIYINKEGLIGNEKM